MAKALTTRFIESVKPTDKRQGIADGGTKGVGSLYLVVQPSGARSWAVRGRIKSRPGSIKHTIGSLQVYDLTHAREEARRCLKLMREGVHPGEEREQRLLAERRDALDNVVAEYLERHARTKTREKSWRETERILAVDIIPLWHGRSLQSITRLEIEDAIADKAKTAPFAAVQMLARIKGLFSWSVKRGLIDKSPAQGIDRPAKFVGRERVLDDAELKLVWEAASDIAAPFGALLRMLIITAQRRGEVAGMTWDEIDLAKALWSMPGSRTKNAKPHTVPLTAPALALLTEMAEKTRDKGHGQVFTCNGHLGPVAVSSFSNAKRELDEKITDRNGGVPLKPWVVHDIRRTVATGLQKLGVRLEVSEAVLNHASGSISGVAAVYHRHDFDGEKRQALNAWANHLESVLTGKPQPDNIVAFSSAVA